MRNKLFGSIVIISLLFCGFGFAYSGEDFFTGVVFEYNFLQYICATAYIVVLSLTMKLRKNNCFYKDNTVCLVRKGSRRKALANEIFKVGVYTFCLCAVLYIGIFCGEKILNCTLSASGFWLYAVMNFLVTLLFMYIELLMEFSQISGFSFLPLTLLYTSLLIIGSGIYMNYGYLLDMPSAKIFNFLNMINAANFASVTRLKYLSLNAAYPIAFILFFIIVLLMLLFYKIKKCDLPIKE